MAFENLFEEVEGTILELDDMPKEWSEEATKQEITLPKGYFTKDGKLFMNEEKKEIEICGNVPTIEKRIFNVSKDEVLYTVSWKNKKGKVKRYSISKLQLISQDELRKFANKDLLLKPSQIRNLATYFAEAAELADEMAEEITSFEHIGWNAIDEMNEDEKILVNPYSNNEDYVIESTSKEFNRIINTVATKGTLESYRECVLKPLHNEKRILFGILAACASPLVHIAKIDNFITTYSAISSSGKTVGMKVINSVAYKGAKDSGRKIRSWDMTTDYFTKVVATYGGMPIILDDTAKNTDRKSSEMIENCIYIFSDGATKGKGNADGVRDTETFEGTLVTCGESKIAHLTEKDGAVARCIEIPDTIWEDMSIIPNVCEAIENHYGVVMEAIIEAIHKDIEKYGEETLTENWQKAIKAYRAKYYNRAVNDIQKRYSNQLAFMEAVARWLSKRGIIDIPSAVVEFEFDIIQNDSITDKPKEALFDFVAEKLGDSSAIWNRGQCNERLTKPQLIIKDKRNGDTIIGIEKSAFNKTLNDSHQYINALIKNGYIYKEVQEETPITNFCSQEKEKRVRPYIYILTEKAIAELNDRGITFPEA